MRRRVAGLSSVVATVFLVAGCSNSSPPAAPVTATTTPAATTTTPTTTTTAQTSAVTGMQALFCPPQTVGGWLAVDPVSRQISAKPVVQADCSLSNVDRVFRYSRGFTYQGTTVQGADGVSVGYVPSGQSDAAGLVDEGGKGTAASISTPLFNPVTGDLWWGQDGHLFSNTVPPTSPVDHGPGVLFTFSTSGEAMPAPTFSSPSGAVTAVATLHGYTYGPSSKMTSACVQEYYLSSGARGSTMPSGAFCGGKTNTTTACNAPLGFVSESEIACLARTGTSGYADTIRVYSLTEPSAATTIVKPGQESIYHANVSPDGKYVLYTTSTATSTALNVAPTDGSAATTAPEPLQQWTTNITSGAIIGWIRADGQPVP